MAYIETMAGRLVTVAETQLFVRQATKIWKEPERDEFIAFIAANRGWANRSGHRRRAEGEVDAVR